VVVAAAAVVVVGKRTLGVESKIDKSVS